MTQNVNYDSFDEFAKQHIARTLSGVLASFFLL
jgi:hypothetical protein